MFKGKPDIDHSANNRGVSRHLEASYGLMREWVREQGQVLPFHLAPAATVPVRMPNQVDRTLTHASPVRYQDGVLNYVDFHQRAGRNQIAHGVILQADHCIAISSGIKALAQSRRQSCEFLRIQFEQVGPMTIEAGVEVRLSAETGFARFNPGQARFGWSSELPYLVGVDPKYQQKLFQ